MRLCAVVGVDNATDYCIRQQFLSQPGRGSPRRREPRSRQVIARPSEPPCAAPRRERFSPLETERCQQPTRFQIGFEPSVDHRLSWLLYQSENIVVSPSLRRLARLHFFDVLRSDDGDDFLEVDDGTN